MQYESNLTVNNLKRNTALRIFWYGRILKTKQWNCEARLYLYPQTSQNSFATMLEPWALAFHSKGDQFAILATSIVDTMPRFEVLIVNEDYQKTKDWVHSVMLFYMSKRMIPSTKLVLLQILVFRAQQDKQPVIKKIQNVCILCDPTVLITLHDVSNEQDILKEMQDLNLIEKIGILPL